MAKKASKKVTYLSPAEIDLRRWAIEQAIRWPWDPGAAGASMYPSPGRAASQPDILHRATAILDWVSK